MLKRIKGFTLIELLIVVAIIAILAAIAVPNFLEAQTRSKVSRVVADMRSYATGIESYYVDNNSYPAQDSSQNNATNGFGVNRGLTSITANLRRMPTFRIKKDLNDALFTLTTPISYLTSYFPDIFATSKGATPSYSRDTGSFGSGWIMWSFGPDSDETNGAWKLDGSIDIGGDIGLISGAGGVPFVESEWYAPGRKNVPSPLLIDSTYDPTNGTTSNGVVYRVKN
jgi:prepilin-type N-terminal cleavage/methylation domain-containing protein